jgi:ABC-type hemin transport system substrate-binding protein
MRNILILAGLSVAAVAGGTQLRTTLKASEVRAATAAEWCREDAQFIAVGAFNTTLVMALSDQTDIVGCDAMVDRVIADPKIVGEIRAGGFTTIQCGSRKEKI